MGKEYACSKLPRFFCCLFIGVVFAFAKADAQPSTFIKNETCHLQALFKVVDIHIFQYLELEIRTTDADQVLLVTTQNGEYKNAVVLSSIIRNDSLIITDPLNPSFSFPQDKLSAHKIIDGKATLFLPRNKQLVINTQTADLDIAGSYQSVYINQLAGSCTIAHLKGDLKYVSVYAAVFLDLKNYEIQSASRSGKVFAFERPTLTHFFAQVETISGNISHFKKTYAK